MDIAMRSLRYRLLVSLAACLLTVGYASAQDSWHRGNDSLVYVARDTMADARKGITVEGDISRYDKRIARGGPV